MNIREYQGAIDEATAVHSKRIEEVHRELREEIARITADFIGNDVIAAKAEYASYRDRDEDRIREAMAEAQDNPGRVITR